VVTEEVVAAPARPFLARKFSAASVRNGMVTFGPMADLIIFGLVALAVPWLATPAVALVAPLARRVDPYDYWLQPTVHQIGSLVITLALMRLTSSRSWREWGFNLRHWRAGIAMAALFAVIVTGPLYLLMEQQPVPAHPISPFQIAAVLVAHFLVISFTQEVLFRAFVMGVLAQQWPRTAGIWATLIFVLAHVKFSPPYIWPEQIGFASAFGLAYAIMFSRTNSLLGPTLAHGYSNAIFLIMMMLASA
jgi:membrane protease YdiL (CAAX protease family)